jgi:GWxTD domain-containing protein
VNLPRSKFVSLMHMQLAPVLARSLLTVLSVLSVQVPALAAQAPADRRMLEAYQDSLASTRDTTGLLAQEKRMVTVAKADRDSTLLHLKIGFLLLRVVDLGGAEHLDDAGSEFEWAAELEPNWPYPWYGIGKAELADVDETKPVVTGFQTLLGKDPLTRAANAFAHSAEVDPSFVKGLVELAATALAQRINSRITVARNALREAARTTAAANPEVLLYRGRVEREVGDVDSALAAFWGYLDKGGVRGLGLLEVARTLFLLGRLDGQAPYYEGAALDDSAGVKAYRGDLSYIADPGVLKEFDQARGAYRAEWLQRFWAERDAADLRVRGERLREHYRRLYFARKNYRLVATNRHYFITETFRSGSRDFDDRGLIYIRQGPPDEKATWMMPGLQPNETWRYDRPEGNLILHFVANEDVQDYKLVESVYDILGYVTSLALLRGDSLSRAFEIADQLVVSRDRLDPIYHKLEVSGITSPAGMRIAKDEREMGRLSIASGTTTDSYVRTYQQPLAARAVATPVGVEGDQPVLQVGYAISGKSLVPVTSSRGYLYPIRIHAAVLDPQGAVIATLDTTRVFLARQPVPAQEHLLGRVAIPVIPGTGILRFSIQQGEETGVLFLPDTFQAGDPRGTAFSASDVAIGSRTIPLAFLAGPEDTVLLNPLSIYPRGGALEMYAEVYGLPAEAPFRMELVVLKRGGGGLFGIFGGKRTQVGLKSEERATGPRTILHRSLGLEKLSAGDYWLELDVTDGEGHSVRRRQAFQVIEPKAPPGH